MAGSSYIGEIVLTETVIEFDGLINHCIEWFKCDECGEKFSEQEYHYKKDNFHLCSECTFKNGKVDKDWFLASMGIYSSYFQVGINNGMIEIWKGSTVLPWEKPNTNKRNYVGYKEWRKEVFIRDNFTCRQCGKIGGVLNAHHIKSFVKYPNLRIKISNGITYCEKCHKEYKW